MGQSNRTVLERLSSDLHKTEQDLSVFVGTWNVGNAAPPDAAGTASTSHRRKRNRSCRNCD
jgi:hypothetical protein